MPFHFCPQCGTRLQPDFRYCPSCGEKLPCPVDTFEPLATTTSPSVSPLKRDETEAAGDKIGLPASNTTYEATESVSHISSIPISTRPALRKTRNSLRLDKGDKLPIKSATRLVATSSTPVTGNSVRSQVSPPEVHAVATKLNEEVVPALEASSSPVSKSPGRGKGKTPRSVNAWKQVEGGKKSTDKTKEPTLDCSPLPVSSPLAYSPSVVKGKAKKAKRVPAVEPLEEGCVVTDTTGRQWTLVKLLSQSATELIYEVSQNYFHKCTQDLNHILKLGAKDGRIFNEQNFLQRAAKPSSVDKWIKLNKMEFLGIPHCVGFGLHADSYRFLIFSNMGQTLQSIMEEENELLPEKAILQLACRILDVLEYIHSNEYVHADIHAENIYIKPGELSHVCLVGYCHAFRYCPGGQHVEYREDSRTPHEGAIEFISLDAHKGAAPSRRSDLQSLGYCMLRWLTGTLPWMALTNPNQVAATKQRYMEDVPALVSHCCGKKRVCSALQAYLTEVMSLQYSDQPDYAALKAGLSACICT